MKNHLKRIATPRTWVIDRKAETFITRPNPGAHSLYFATSLGVVLRDKLGLVSTMSEAKKVLNRKNILVDGKRRKDHRFAVGLFDVISVPETKKSYRALLDQKGRLVIQKIDEKGASLKPCKIVGKKVLAKGKLQFNLHDGKNIISDKKAKVGDTFILSLPSLEVKEVLSLKEGNFVFLTQGKHGGHSGILKEIKGKEAIYVADKTEIETAKAYLFVLGEKDSKIKLYSQK